MYLSVSKSKRSKIVSDQRILLIHWLEVNYENKEMVSFSFQSNLLDLKYVNPNLQTNFNNLNLLSANPTKWSNTLNNLSAFADELFECV